MERIIDVATGRDRADLVLTNARVVNVFNGEVEKRDIAVTGGYIAGFCAGPAREKRDLGGRFVAPGFIDPHVHIESSMVSVTEFARAVLPFGTTSVVADPHEIANVLGIEGIRHMLRSAENQPMDIYFSLPSCVPATHMETSGAALGPEDLEELITEHRVRALAEMMNFPGVIHKDPDVMEKIRLAKASRKRVDGHAPALTGGELQAYAGAGIHSDHECTDAGEAMEKLALGLHIMVREGTGARNLDALLPLVNETTCHRMMWCTDDRHPHDLLAHGHIDDIVRKAIAWGVDPVSAIRMATLNPARYFDIRTAGAIAPGRVADMVVFSDLAAPRCEQVYRRGVLTAENGSLCSDVRRPASVPLQRSMHVHMGALNFAIAAESKRARVIDVIPGQIITRGCIMDIPVTDGMAGTDVDGDVLKIAVVERHAGTGNIGKGFVRGFGLKQGALASSVAHDSHNIIVVGANDADMKTAVGRVAEMDGGLAVACGGEIRAELALPIAGLMSHQPVADVRDRLDGVLEAARGLGCRLADPFMTISFLALPVIPELKITDKGLVDVDRFEIVPLFVP